MRGDFNPRSPQGERPKDRRVFGRTAKISIHAPRRGSDIETLNHIFRNCPFQSTLPAGGATEEVRLELFFCDISIHAPRRGSDALAHAILKPPLKYFNPRSPQGERRVIGGVTRASYDISIHAPRRGSDFAARAFHFAALISIHAPRRGSDYGTTNISSLNAAISIHAPRRGSDAAVILRTESRALFQSTLPAGGATNWQNLMPM